MYVDKNRGTCEAQLYLYAKYNREIILKKYSAAKLKSYIRGL